jgi:hypothetical protein
MTVDILTEITIARPLVEGAAYAANSSNVAEAEKQRNEVSCSAA